MSLRSFVGLGLCLLPTLKAAEALPLEQVKFFEAKIRPMLATSCYKCHSQADGKTKGGLTLDTKAGWEKGGETGPALVPGDPGQSLLIKAVRYEDPDMQMPPSSKGGKLLPEQIADLEAWVKMGAPDPRSQTAPRRDISKIAAGLDEGMRESIKTHWAYQPVSLPAMPATNNPAWCKTPVDRFILAKLEEKGIKPSAPADKRTLIRRATFDLTGLPPSPREVLDFVRDESPDAYAKVVDRLLASPHYGERWGRYWLDVARYADTRGEVKKESTSLNPFAWTYRDYVIKAFNSDRPYNVFVQEQIAADLMPSAATHPGTLAALGFLTGGDQFQGNKNDIINDQIDVVTKGFLGTTVTCARCHDHFFDPVPSRDYYSLHGIFNSCTEPDELPIIGNSPDKKAQDAYLSERRLLELKGYATIDREMCRMAAKFNIHADTFLLGLAKIRNGHRATDPDVLAFLAKDSISPDDLQTAQRSLQIRMKANIGKPDDRKEPGKKGRGAGRRIADPILGLWNELSRLTTADFALRSQEIIGRYTAAENSDAVNPLVAAAFRGRKIDSLEAAARLYQPVFHKAQDAYKSEFDAWKASAGENAIFKGLRDPQLEQIRCAVFDSKPFLGQPFSEILGGLSQELQRSIGDLIRQLAGLDLSHPGAMARANVLIDTKAKNSPVFIRGEAKSPGPVVPRQFLEFIDPERKPFPDNASGRLELAIAIAAPTNPLTSRVIVNRVWQHHFGQGFVSTPDDLGVMSEAPSHPELCNWLAATFVENGWSLKELHRLIMTSAVYQQSSEPNPASAKLDPFNRLLWRANVQRLDFESLRDSFLAIGGKIDLTMYGHPMNIETEPYSPRRTIYGFVDRLNMAEFMKNFDMANPQLPTGRRHETVVPQQALFRMNSLLVIEQARNVIDRKEFKQATTDAERIRVLYEIIYQRWPKPEEIKLAEAFVHAKTAGSSSTGSGKASGGSTDTKVAKQAQIEEFLKRDPATLDPKQRARQEEMKKRMAEVAMKAKQNGRLNELVNDPNAARVDRSALDGWEEFAHALLMTSEAAYLN